MSERIHVLAQRLLGKASIEDCDLDEVKNLAGEFPYFAPAQFLLLEKLKQVNPEEYATQLQRSILYYPNPLEFQYFISSGRFYTEFEKADDPFGPADEEDQVNEPPPEQQHPAEVSQDQEEGFTSVPPEESLEIEIPDEEEQDIHSLEKTAEDGTELRSGLEETPAAEFPADEKERSGEETTALEEDTEPSPSVAPMAARSLPVPLEQGAAAGELSFEPYHTVDYFASQGIRLSQEEVPKDKFGKQLKSFTEWLKTMKRLPAAQANSQVDSGSESRVQHLAEDSIHESDVWTEAMAEVWTKQGNHEKAIETYHKLSLLNPSKMAYFAAKIENLKRS